jgi:hypothetical protein
MFVEKDYLMVVLIVEDYFEAKIKNKLTKKNNLKLNSNI